MYFSAKKNKNANLINFSIVLPKKNTIAPTAKNVIENAIIGKYFEFKPTYSRNKRAVKSEKWIPTYIPTRETSRQSQGNIFTRKNQPDQNVVLSLQRPNTTNTINRKGQNLGMRALFM